MTDPMEEERRKRRETRDKIVALLDDALSSPCVVSEFPRETLISCGGPLTSITAESRPNELCWRCGLIRSGLVSGYLKQNEDGTFSKVP